MGEIDVELARSDRGWMTGVADDDVVTIGDPRLKASTQAIDDARDAGDLLKTMTDRLRALNGAGLAAPQIGASVKAIVVEVRKTDVFPDRPISPLLQMINPVIVRHSPETEIGWEGCFSVPGLMGLVPRAAEVTLKYMSANGEPMTEVYSGYVARTLQHEIDHLNGIEFVDRMTSMESLTSVTNYLRFYRNQSPRS